MHLFGCFIRNRVPCLYLKSDGRLARFTGWQNVYNVLGLTPLPFRISGNNDSSWFTFVFPTLKGKFFIGSNWWILYYVTALTNVSKALLFPTTPHNKFCIFDASIWLFYTKLITMHGHLNVKYGARCKLNCNDRTEIDILLITLVLSVSFFKWTRTVRSNTCRYRF